ncbi:MAG: thioredoxin family protein [Aliishimia sp.]
MAKKKTRKSAAQKSRKSAAPSEPTRRDTLKLMRNGALGAVVLGGAGWFSVSAVRATAAEIDLTRVGQGTPSIVQIHDPSCPLCTRLQRETRAALEGFGDDEIVYLVANINGDEGRSFAAKYGVPHVTLLLFNGAGELQQELRGVRDSKDLRPIFESLRDNV